MSTSQPSYEQLVGLPVWAAQPVPMPFEDVNGDLSVRHYLGIASEGLDESLVDLGIPRNWPTTHKQANFSAEHHCTYLRELHTGDNMSCRVRLLGRSERALHSLIYVLDDTHERLSCVVEEMSLHIDLSVRRTSPWPEDVAVNLDRRITEHQNLPFDSPISGCMALR